MRSNAHDRRPADAAVQDRRVDEVARRLHADSLTTLSPQTLSRLRAARQASATVASGRHWLAWTLASTSAAIIALAIGMQLQVRPSDAPPPKIAATAPIEELDAAGLGDEYRSLSASLDENPEFYLWLASNHDALALNTERRNDDR